MSKPDKESFYKTIGYSFKDASLFENALTHSSYANETGMDYEKNNERLEFLGDAVLELASSRHLFDKKPSMVEGDMTTIRASLVCELSLAAVAREIGLGDMLNLGNGEEKTGGRQRDSILSDALEALIGAIYIDGGYAEAERFIGSFLLNDIENKALYYDSKSKLQEIVQEKYHERSEIKYELTEESGPAHNKRFTVLCKVQGTEIASGEGPTKKKAEQEAAYRALLAIKESGI